MERDPRMQGGNITWNFLKDMVAKRLTFVRSMRQEYAASFPNPLHICVFYDVFNFSNANAETFVTSLPSCVSYCYKKVGNDKEISWATKKQPLAQKVKRGRMRAKLTHHKSQARRVHLPTMPRNLHPLVGAIDAGQWDAEAPLGRIVLVAHAALLDSGFVLCGNQASRRVPTQVGLTASTLSLRYSIPELVHPRDDTAADAAVLRLCSHGNFLILYGYLTGDGSRPSARWACIHAHYVAPVLSGDLDATARALVGDALGVRIWKALADGVGRRLFLQICARNVALLQPRFMSLPADLQASILRRLAGVSLAMVECTCAELRDLVADRELWKARYMAEHRFLFFGRRSRFASDESEILGACRSWKEKYVKSRWFWPPWPRWRYPLHALRWSMDDLRHLRLEDFRYDLYARSVSRRELDRCKRLDPTQHMIRRFQQMKSQVRVRDGDVHRRITTVHGNGRRRCNKLLQM